MDSRSFGMTMTVESYTSPYQTAFIETGRLLFRTPFFSNPLLTKRVLFHALQSRRIAGAAIDVWYRYPAQQEEVLPSAYPFHTLDNILMTPHTSGLTEGTMRYRWQVIADNLWRLAHGSPLLNIVWPPDADGAP